MYLAPHPFNNLIYPHISVQLWLLLVSWFVIYYHPSRNSPLHLDSSYQLPACKYFRIPQWAKFLSFDSKPVDNLESYMIWNMIVNIIVYTEYFYFDENVHLGCFNFCWIFSWWILFDAKERNNGNLLSFVWQLFRTWINRI